MSNEERAQLWVSGARVTFSSILGRKLGDDDQASFRWTDDKDLKPAKQSRTAATAAGWRSIGNLGNKLASAIRKRKALECTTTVSLGARLWDLYQSSYDILQSEAMQDTREDGTKMAG